MQPFSSTRVPLSDVTSNLYPDEPAKTNPSGTLGKFAVAVQSGVTSFFSSLSPNYIPEHQRQTKQATAPVTNTLPADNKNDKTSLVANVLQGVGLASKAISCWVPNASAVSDAVGTLCSSFSLAHSLDNMAMSGKSGKESSSGAENESKSHSQKITDNNRKDEKPGKPVTASGTTNSVSGSVSGPAIATVTLMAMDRLAGAAAQPADGKPGTSSARQLTSSLHQSKNFSVGSDSSRPYSTQTSASSNSSTSNTVRTSRQPTMPSLNKMDSTTNLPSHTSTGTSPLLSSSAQATQSLLNTNITADTISTPLPPTDARITTTTPLATAAMTTTASVTETVVTLPEASMTFSGTPPAAALPITPAPLAGTISTWVVVCLGTAVAFVACRHWSIRSLPILSSSGRGTATSGT
ncbi:hypothetical protein [Endozoicomonas acroporae]|uniref:hypothetical protein n=1 Tax=Endozoicomonas acroporae TaxID=1701104 RepID=UPI0013D22443|nr:hypothetical protein [Endozoicomonas acroporae]